MYGIVVDGEVKYVSCIEDFKDLIGTEIYDMMVRLWKVRENELVCALEEAQAELDDTFDRAEDIRKKARDYEEKWLRATAENKYLREELLTLKEKLGG